LVLSLPVIWISTIGASSIRTASVGKSAHTAAHAVSACVAGE